MEEMNRWKKRIGAVLACAMCVGAMSAVQMTAEAAVNGEVICEHHYVEGEPKDHGYRGVWQGHMHGEFHYKECTMCGNVVDMGVVFGPLEAHDWEWNMIEDMQNGLYMFDIWCPTCGYSDTAMSDDPTNPRL